MISEEINLVTPRDLRIEIEELRRGLLPVFVFPLLAAPLIWVLYAASRDWSSEVIDLVDVAVLQLVCSVYVVFRLRERHYLLACGALLLSLIVAEGLVISAYPEPLVMCFGTFIIVVAQALLGAWGALATAGLAWAVAVSAVAHASGGVMRDGHWGAAGRPQKIGGSDLWPPLPY